MAKSPAVAAIEYALNTDSDGMAFLRCWLHGEFPEIREEWPDVPEEVFIGADPLHPQTKIQLEQDVEIAELIQQAQRHMTRTKEADAVSVAMTQFLMRQGDGCYARSQPATQTDFAGNPDRVHRVATVVGHTSVEVGREHIERLVSAIALAAGDCFGSVLCLHGYMPPYKNAADAPDGYMEFWVKCGSGSDLAFAVEFGSKELERSAFHELTRRVLEDAAKIGDPVNTMASVATFDELWLFACNVAERLKVTKVEMAFGV